MRIVISEAARQDLASQSQWYFQQAGDRLADRYMAAFDDTLAVLAAQPEIGSRRKFRDARLQGLRSAIMFGAFRVHLVFYRVVAERLFVFRVLHGMRDLPRRLLDMPGD